MRRLKPGLAFVFCLLALFIAACSSSSARLPASGTQVLKAGISLGQTFTAEKSGLAAIALRLAPDTPGTGSLLFHLRSDPQSRQDIAAARLPLADVTGQADYFFDFPPQLDSQRQDYFLSIEISGQGQAKVFTAPPEAYLDGSSYVGAAPQESQLVFQLRYDRKAYLAGLARQSLRWLGVLAIGLFAFVLPGWALFSLLWPGWEQLSWGEQLGLASGLSLAVYPLLLLWTAILRLRLGAVYAWLPPLAAILALLWKNRRKLFPRQVVKVLLAALRKALAPDSLALLGVIAFLIVSRFWLLQKLDLPMFGDSYQHTLITQLILDQGGLFNSWAPYSELTTFTYHFGFHTAAAVLAWLGHISAPRAVLWAGQLLNIIAVLGLYPLAVKISRNRWAGVAAMLVAGLLAPMPSFYINWGRYTQLAGQAVLPAAVYICWELLDRPLPTATAGIGIRRLLDLRGLGINLSTLVVAWIALGGLGLAHYRILILAVCFFPVYFLMEARSQTWLTKGCRTAWLGLGGGLLFLPWFIHVFGGRLMRIVGFWVTTAPPAASAPLDSYNATGDLFSYLPSLVWLLLPLAVAWLLWRRNRKALVFTLWWFLIFMAANPALLRLPGTGVLNNFSILIFAYLPAGVLLGAALGELPASLVSPTLALGARFRQLALPLRLLLPWGFLLVILALGAWGASQRIHDLQPATFSLVTRPDLRAAAWIRQNTPADAGFLVNTFFAFSSTLVGSDGGWWLPYLAGRATNLPPMNYGFEADPYPGYRQSLTDLWNTVETQGLDSQAALDVLAQHHIQYIYIGQRQGSVNYSGPRLLDPQKLAASAHFHVVYHQDRVWIFAIHPR